MNNTDDNFLTATTQTTTSITVKENELEIPFTITTTSTNGDDSTQDTVTIVNTILDHFGSEVTDDISKTTLPSIVNDSAVHLKELLTDDISKTTFPSIINDSIVHLEELLTDDISKTTLPSIVNDSVSHLEELITDNISKTTVPSIVNDSVTQLEELVRDDISKTDNGYMTTTLPSIVNDSVDNLDELVTKANEAFTNISNLFNDTDKDSINENTLIDDDYISTTLPSFINDSIHHLEDTDAKANGSFINIINVFNSTEYNPNNGMIEDSLSTSTEIYLTTDITVAPQTEGNVSLNVIIHKVLNNTLNNDTIDFNKIPKETLSVQLNKSLGNNFTSEIFQNVHNVNNSNYGETPSVTHWIDDGAEVENLLFVSYHLVFPILIFLAILFNCLALYVFRKPKLASLSESSYLQFLSGVNILCALNAIPATILKNHCPFTTYSSAIYYTYFSWTFVFLLRSLSICSLVWMSYDKFLYIWSLTYLQKVIQPAVVRKRLILSTVIMLIAFLPLICIGKVKGCSDVSPTCNVNEEEKWLSFAGYRRDLENTWFAVLIVFLVQGTIHIILILLTISLFTGLKQKIFKRRKRQMDQTVVLIINNSSYLILDVMYTITALFFYKNKYDQGHCYNSFSKERWLAVVNSLLMFWSTFSILIFLAQSRAYRNQVMSILFRCITWDNDDKVRKSVRHSIQLQQINRQSIQLQQVKKPEVTQL